VSDQSPVIALNHVVEINYRLIDTETGSELDSSKDHGPLTYVHGHSQLAPGLERVLSGKTVGFKESVTCAPADAYGEVDPDRILKISKEQMEDEVKPGEIVQGTAEGGSVVRLIVKSIEGDEITLDANHPLAGRTLTYDVEVMAVREGSEEELEALAGSHCDGSGNCPDCSG
jgi:FKBP-type peptidyl-prolyl cis-trans isomerase SlyD